MPIEQHADHALARGDHARAVAGVHALGEQRDLEVADHEAAQRRRRPQLVVVRAARVEADDERRGRRCAARGDRCTRAGRSCRDSSHASISTTQRACGSLSRAERVDRGERREDRVAVVGAAAAVELVALDHRRPRAEALAPAGHLGLLVEVAVEHHGVAGLAAGARDVDEDDRRARRLEPHDLERRALGQVLLRPAREQLDRASMWPFFFHSGSNIGDLFGILMYSTSVGTIDVANCSSTHFAVASVTGMRGTLTHAAPRRLTCGFSALRLQPRLMRRVLGLAIFLSGCAASSGTGVPDLEADDLVRTSFAAVQPRHVALQVVEQRVPAPRAAPRRWPTCAPPSASRCASPA